jgi:hypothetical protein
MFTRIGCHCDSTEQLCVIWPLLFAFRTMETLSAYMYIYEDDVATA